MVILILTFLLAYLLGSVPMSVWLGRAIKGVDLRAHGSGNAGATNAFRVLGKPIGTAVLVLDMLKGFLAVYLSHLQDAILPSSEGWMIFRISLGLLAVVAVHPYGALAAMGIYLLVFLIFKLSALGSLSAVISYPVWVILVFQSEYMAVWCFSIIVPLLVFITHHSNIQRLIHREEKSPFR